MQRRFELYSGREIGNENMREDWVFRYKPSEVLAAAEKQVKHHVQRGKWWQAEADKAEQLLKKKGFEYRSQRNSYGDEVKIVGDPELATRVAECKKNVKRHKEEQK